MNGRTPRRALAHVIRVLNDDGTVKVAYELDEHGRHTNPLRPPARKTAPCLPAQLPSTQFSSFGKAIERLDPSEIMATLDYPMAFLDEALQSSFTADINESFRTAHWFSGKDGSNTGYGNWTDD
jgi:hypothetical protein